MLQTIRESVPEPLSGISLLKLPKTSESLHVSYTKVFQNHRTGWFGSSNPDEQMSDWSTLGFIYTNARQCFGCSSHAKRVSAGGGMGWRGLSSHLGLSSTGIMPAPWGANRSGELRGVREMHLCAYAMNQ